MPALLHDRPVPHRVKSLVWSRGGTLRGFARFAKVSERWVTAVLRGDARPSPNFIASLAAYLDVDEDDIRQLFEAEEGPS